ncbi:MAG: hypothetical protein HN757_10290, partial [Calditrichaeota bacterium]|nr:hypothetical protein [Calditrichota bacterium]
MQKRLMLLILLIAAVFLIAEDSFADPMVRYQYLTNFERTKFNEIIWFWSPDTIFGPVHSNGYLGIKRGWFEGQVSTSRPGRPRDDWRHYFALEPIFNAPP